MSFQKAYNISLFNNVPYPYEQYQSIVDSNYINVDSIDRNYIFTNILRYQKRPTNEVLFFFNPDIVDPNSANAILYYDTTTSSTYLSSNNEFANQPKDINNGVFYAENVSTIRLNPNTTIYFNASSLRQRYKTPREFQIFYIQTDVTSNNCYGYILYPNRLFLNPTSISTNGTTWNLTTRTNIIACSAIYLNSTSFESEAYPIHKQYLSNVPSLCSLLDLSNTYTLTYNICAARTKMGAPIISFTPSYNPSSVSKQFETDTVYLNPDSTFLSYSASFINSAAPVGEQTIYISQQHPYSYVTQGSYTFTSSYILNHNPISSAVQSFQMIQRPIVTTKPLGDSSNCIIKSDVNLNTSNLTYANNGANGGVPGSTLTFDYIADALNIGATPAISTLNSVTIGGSPYTVNTNITSTTVGNNDIVWVTQNPPHYYSYKTNLKTNSNSYLDSFGLNFYLKTSALNAAAVDGSSYTLSLNISSFITSDYNALKYDLYNGTKNEKIKYTITNIGSVSGNNTSYISLLSAQYGPAGDTYNLVNSPWVDSKAGSYLHIYYPPLSGQLNLTLRASLSGSYGTMDAFEDISAVLARQHTATNNGNSLFLDILAEDSNIIVVDSSFNKNAVAWPTRDLRLIDANTGRGGIIWLINSNESFVKLYSVDTDTKKFIKNITPGEILTFDDTTQTIAVSGYGPQQIQVTLSSLYYNESAKVFTNPLLFDYFGENVFSVTPKVELNNLNRVRTIDLKIQVPYQGKLYDIPKYLNTPIYWTWTYDDTIDPTIQPISAFEPLNNNVEYNYGTSTNYSSVSAITIKVLPETNIIPTIHNVTVYASSDIRYPSITGSYTFQVDDFPDRTILNSDFKTYYTAFSTTQIADTYEGMDTITRPADNDLSFTLVDNKDFLSNIKFKQKAWVLNNTNILNTYSDSIIYNLNVVGLSTSKITLRLDSAIAPGWTSAHNVSATEYFYAINPIQFYKPLEFILYPEYAWINSETLTLLTPNNYTLSFRPSSYENKKSNSQTYWLSANKNSFTQYNYTNLNNYYTSSLSSSNSFMDIVYDPTDISIYTGIPIALECYNNTTYPSAMGTTYLAPSGLNLGQFSFTNNFQTLEYNDNDISDFRLSPTITPYNDLQLNYIIDTKIINLDISRNVVITQTLSTIPKNSPAVVSDGTITYFLSSQFWTVSSVIPAVNGTYTIFQLNYGDPTIPLFAGQDGLDRYYMYAETDVIQQIPPTTFPTGVTDYAGNTDLWNSITL